VTLVWGISPRQPSGKNIIRWLLKKEQMVVSAIASTPHNAILTSVLSSTGMRYGNVENQPQSIPAHTSEQSDDCADSSPGNSIQKNGSENMTHGAPDITN
ncbi:hypothetical protein ACVOAG_21880, partial [Shigella flexneri]